MSRWIPLLFLSLLSCGQREYTAEECRALATPKAYLDRCMGGTIYGNYIGDLKCWPFSQPQRLQGVLLAGFEYSEFHPHVMTVKQAQNTEPKIWFDSNVEMPVPVPRAEIGLPHAWLIDAEGRLSVCDAWFGHLGQYPREFIATKYYSTRVLPVR